MNPLPRPRVLSYTMRLFGLLSAGLLVLPHGAPAQVAVADEGSFTITHDRARVGKETFTIRRAGPGSADAYVANGTTELQGRRLLPALRTDASFDPIAYQLEIRQGDDVVTRLKGIAGRGRFSTQVRTAKGESTKEFIAADDALLLDDDVFHQYYFVAQRAAKLGAAGGTIPVIVPQRSEQQMLRAQWAADDRLTIGGASVSARHLVLTGPGGKARNVWVDAQGRLLQVSVESSNLLAQRDALPH